MSALVLGTRSDVLRVPERRLVEGACVNVNPSGICQCGCGMPAPISPITSTARGYVKGTHRRFIQGHHGRTLQVPRTLIIEATDVDHAWAAGIIDGEGCIQIRRARLGHQLYLTVGQSGQRPGPMLQRLQALYGGRIWEHRAQAAIGDGSVRKPHFIWGTVAVQAAAVLGHVQPFIVEKTDQVAIALAYRAHGVGVGKREIAEGYREELREARRLR